MADEAEIFLPIVNEDALNLESSEETQIVKSQHKSDIPYLIPEDPVSDDSNTR
jgi:tRNA splicing ligase